jgi:hypothetical protein
LKRSATAAYHLPLIVIVFHDIEQAYRLPAETMLSRRSAELVQGRLCSCIHSPDLVYILLVGGHI